MGDSYLYREIQDDYNSFARVNAVRVFAKVNAISFSLKAAFTFSIHTAKKNEKNLKKLLPNACLRDIITKLTR